MVSTVWKCVAFYLASPVRDTHVVPDVSVTGAAVSVLFLNLGAFAELFWVESSDIEHLCNCVCVLATCMTVIAVITLPSIKCSTKTIC